MGRQCTPLPVRWVKQKWRLSPWGFSGLPWVVRDFKHSPLKSGPDVLMRSLTTWTVLWFNNSLENHTNLQHPTTLYCDYSGFKNIQWSSDHSLSHTHTPPKRICLCPYKLVNQLLTSRDTRCVACGLAADQCCKTEMTVPKLLLHKNQEWKHAGALKTDLSWSPLLHRSTRGSRNVVAH